MVLGTAIGASQANAQALSCSGASPCSVTNNASATVGTLVKLDQTSNSTALGDPTANQIDLGATIGSSGPTLSIKANRDWTLKISTTQANFSWSGPGLSDPGVKPISHLQYSSTSSGPFTAISQTGATLNSGAKSSLTSQPIFFQTVWVAGLADQSNAPGTYTLPVVFTLSAP
jgi:hypothetical protein